MEEKSSVPKTLTLWVKFLKNLTERFFPSDNDTFLDRRRVQDAIMDLGNEYSKLANDSVVPLRVIRYHLKNVLEVGSPKGQFLTSGIHGLVREECKCKGICLIGMNDGAFPNKLGNSVLIFQAQEKRRPISER